MGGFTARDWVTIGLAVFSAGLTVWLSVGSLMLRRFLKTHDQHGIDIGILKEAKTHASTKLEAHDVANAEMVALVERVRAEANLREGRILDAIDKARTQNTVENTQIRGELSGMTARIDRIKDQSGGQRPHGRT